MLPALVEFQIELFQSRLGGSQPLSRLDFACDQQVNLLRLLLRNSQVFLLQRESLILLRIVAQILLREMQSLVCQIEPLYLLLLPFHPLS